MEVTMAARDSKLVAYCGLDCAQCSAYIATQADSSEAKQAVIRQWGEQHGAVGLSEKDVTCDGCRQFDSSHRGRFGSHCYDCQYRACGMQHGVETCAGCDEYPCERISGFLSAVPGTRENLDELRLAK
jgi:hypothetical protein